MSRTPRFVGPQNLRGLVLLACSLIAATALAALLVMVITARAHTTTRSSAHTTTSSSVCPPDDRGQSAPTQVRSGARRTLVPPGATTLTVCRYNGMNAFGGVPQWGLRGAGASDDRSQIERISAELDALKQTHGVYSCPFSDMSDDVAIFGYSSPPGVVITMDTGDCNTLSNGHVRRLGLGKPVVGQIESVAKPVTGQTWATVRGHLRLCGGPAPGRCYIENYDGSDRVVVTGSDGLWLAMGPVHHGRFAFKVAASGTYTVGLYTGNTLVKRLRRRVTVGRTTTVVFLIAIS